MPEGFARIAAVSLPVHLGDVEANEREIMLALERLRTQGVQAAVFPELCLTGYTLGDLLLHGLVQDRAWAALKRLKAHTDGLTAVVGLPFCHEGRLYNCAAVLANGVIRALVPKTYLPNYGEFYEKRWFEPAGPGDRLFSFCGQEVYLGGTTQLLKFPEYRDADKARDLMTFMVDNKQNLPVPSGNAPVQILIGPENVDAALKESSVVIASYDIGDGMRGLVGVVGPTRMDYASVAARLTCFAESLSHMFEKRQLPPTKEEQS